MQLATCASVIRSKNAGPFEVTIDIMFDDARTFEAACGSALVDRAKLARQMNVDSARVLDVVVYPPALAIKINVARDASSGTVGDRDVYGTQQFIPLLDLDIPFEKEASHAPDGCRPCGAQ